MRLSIAAFLLLLPTTVLAIPRTGLDERGTVIARDDALPDRTYAWSTWVVGDDDTHVVVTEGERADRPARYQAFDNHGVALWTADHACPSFDDHTTLFEVGGRIVCKWQRDIVAIDLATGKEAWRFSDPGPLYITAGAQGRVAVSIANAQLAVLDARDGREVMRLDVDGAVLEAVAPTPDGPLALLVHDTPSRAKDTIELPIGEGGAPVEVELSGDDPGRRLLALPIGGPPQRGAAPMKPRWATPFGGYSFELQPTAGAVVGTPREGVQAAWDLADGRLLWERPSLDGELLVFGEDGAAFARRGEDGNYTWGAMDPRSLATLWQRPLPPGDRPLAGGQGSGDLGLLTSGGLLLVRYRDGAERHTLRVDPGREIASVRSTPKSLLWVTRRDSERWLYLEPLPPL